VLAEFRPEVVFHAAALKHLPLLQMHPEEAVKTNVLGTLNLLDAAAAAGVHRFVNVSTDKAADPISALGYSKRITERLTSWHAALHEGHYLSVRFGNVLGSRGSVLGAFQAQVEAGTAVTVTHPEATRYFMTVEEAVGLVIQAGAVGESGNVLVLDMGGPVRIRDVAQQIIRQSGRELPISYTGLRPGEKIHEALLAVGERDVRPAHPQISHVPVPALAPADVVDGAGLHDPREVSAWLLATATAPLRLPDSAPQTSGLGAP
jgi:FlaA1/EpsC-like NDP-sugar epimerase